MNEAVKRKHTRKNILMEWFPLLFIIFLHGVFVAKIHLDPNVPKKSYIIWNFAQIFGSILFAYISDKHCRKKTLVFILFFSAFFLFFFIHFGFLWYIVGLLGFVFTPISLARAALVDNFFSVSKVKLISFTIIAECFPWIFYSFFLKAFSKNFLNIVLICLIAVLVITFLFFEDRRDKTYKRKILHSIEWRKILYVLLAYFPVQVAYFLSVFFIEGSLDKVYLFASLGTGTAIGALISNFYRSTPHISFLTLFYGIAFSLTCIPIFSTWFFPANHINIAYQLMIFATISGFYIPFLYDVVLSAAHSDYRGIACGIIHVFYSMAALSAFFFSFEKNTALFVLALSALLFFIGMIFQKLAEKKFF